MDYIPYLIASGIGAVSIDLYKNNQNKKTQLNPDFNFCDFEIEDAEILTNEKIEEYTKVNLSK